MRRVLWSSVLIALVAVIATVVSSSAPSEFGAANVATKVDQPHGLPAGLFTPSAVWYRSVLGGLSPSQQVNFSTWILDASPVLESKVLSSEKAPSYVTAAGLRAAVRLTTETNWEGVGGAAAAGCVTGAIIGLAGTPAASAAGCVLGATVGALIDYFAQQTGRAVGDSLELTVDTALVSDALNFLNASAASLRTVLASNNATADFLENQASAAALEQLDYQTWDPIVDIADSGIAAELASDASAFIQQWNGEFGVLDSWGISNYGPSGRFGNGNYAICEFTASQTNSEGSCEGTLVSAAPGDARFETAGEGTSVGLGYQSNVTFYLPVGVPAELACGGTAGAGNGNVSFYEIGGKKVAATFSDATNGNFQDVLEFNSTESGVWYSPYASYSNAYTECQIRATGVYSISTSTGNSIVGGVALGCSGYSPPCAANPAGSDVYTYLGSDPLNYLAPNPGVWGPNGGSDALVFGSAVTMPNFGVYFGNLEVKAELAAETYWAFLKAQGYASTAQIPANCVIPYPSGALPQSSTNALGNATAGEDLAIYEAWLNGLADFFDSPVNATNFCSGHAQFKGAGLLPAPNGINATGFVYLANRTDYPHETFANTSSWALNGSLAGSTDKAPLEMILYPTVTTVSIPVGVKYEVPANDPIVALAPLGSLTFPDYYNLYGNGTNASISGGLTTDVSTPGAAIYLTSCTVGGAAESNCTITLQDLQGYLANISCPDTPTGCGAQPPSGGGAFTWGGLISGLAGFVCAITFGLVCGSAANVVADVLAAVLVLGLVVVAILAVGAALKKGRKGSGSPPPS